jgi:hypothetical protein
MIFDGAAIHSQKIIYIEKASSGEIVVLLRVVHSEDFLFVV